MDNNSSKTSHFNVKDVMEQILRHVGLKAPTFAKTIGINYQRIFDIQNGRTKNFTPQIINLICETYPEVNKLFLYTGEGELFIEPAQQNVPSLADVQLADVIGMSKQVLDLMQRIYDKERDLQNRLNEVNDRERELIEREAEVTQREAELGIKKSISA